MTQILVFAGSVRRDSHNKKLARVAAQAARDAGAQVTLIDLADYPMPLYDGDFEAESGPPEHAFRLQKRIAAQDGLIVVSPEYNNSIPALLKNTIDWISRTPRVSGANPFAGKPVALMAASPGSLGGLRGLDCVRRVMETVGMLVLPQVVAVPQADAAFAADGRLQEEASLRRVNALAGELVRTSAALAGK